MTIWNISKMLIKMQGSGKDLCIFFCHFEKELPIVKEIAEKPVHFLADRILFVQNEQDKRVWRPESTGCQSGILEHFPCDVISEVTSYRMPWMDYLLQLL